jgi:hypothetical protein
VVFFSPNFTVWYILGDAEPACQKGPSLSHLRKFGAWLVCGLVAWLLLGIGGRLVMRVIAVAEHQTPAFSPEATAGTLLVGVIIGLVSATLFVPF